MSKIMTAMAAIFMVLSCWALDVDEVRSQGLAGEKANGYLGVIVDQPQVVELVKSVNIQRRARYNELATKRGTSLENIEKLAGEKLIEKAKSHQYYYQNKHGHWTR